MKYLRYCFILTVVAVLAVVNFTQNDERSSLTATVASPLQQDIQLDVSYPNNWKPIEAQGFSENVVVLGRFDVDALGLETRTAVMTLQLTDASRAIDAISQDELAVFTIEDYLSDPESFVLSERDAAVAIANLEIGLDNLLLTVEVAEGIFAYAQIIGETVSIEDIRAEIDDIVGGVEVTLPITQPSPTPPPTFTPTIPPRACPYLARVEIVSLMAVNSEEGSTGRDFDFDGDQITLSMTMGPREAQGLVNPGTDNQFRIVWMGDMSGGNTVENLGQVERNVCNDTFGLQVILEEDDSTPFSQIQTKLGTAYIPLVTQGIAEAYPEHISQQFSGVTQDGNYDYQIVLGIEIISQEDVDTSKLTPTIPPTITPRPTETATPTDTLTPTATFTETATNTPTATATFTPSDTYTPTLTPSDTATPTITPTPSDTYTPTITFTPSDTFTPTVTFTPSKTPSLTPTFTPTSTNTPTLTPSLTFTPSKTPTLTPTLTPVDTSTPTATYTPSNTPTPSDTPTPTGTPAPISCPGTRNSRLYAGMTGYLIPFGIENRVRDQPALGGQQVGLIELGGIFEVLEGPVCQDGYIWYEVDYNGLIGWTVEGDREDYWVAELKPTATPAPCSVRATANVNQRDAPNGERVGQLTTGETRFVIGQSTDGSGFIWWNLDDETWVREDTVPEEGLCDNVQEVSSD